MCYAVHTGDVEFVMLGLGVLYWHYGLYMYQ